VPVSAAIAGSEVAMTVESMFSMNSAAPKPRSWIPSSGGVRYPDRLTAEMIAEVPNAQKLAHAADQGLPRARRR
jgi:hypothetical protein